MKNWIKLFRDPTPEEFHAQRHAEAARRAEYHRQKAIEAEDAAHWASVQALHHKQMQSLYARRAEVSQ